MKPASPWQPMEIPPDITAQGFLIGTSGYYYDDWIGIFNPPKVRARCNVPLQKRDMLELLPVPLQTENPETENSDEDKGDQDRLRFYQKYFSFVEINNTFYREPLIEHFMDMERRSKASMKYSVKVHKSLSHDTTNNMEFGRDLMRKHIYAVSPLVETGRFFSFLIQLPDYAYRTRKKLDYLLACASEAVKMRIDVHIELRHISWHEASVLQELKNNGVGVCNTEIPLKERAFPLKAYATTDKGYIRYSGLNFEHWDPAYKPVSAKEKLAARNARYDYEYSDEELLEREAGQLTLHKKTTTVAIAFNNHYKAKAVGNAIKNIKMLKSEG
jgi:uncharacterized protein YecE (DUF72 family)